MLIRHRMCKLTLVNSQNVIEPQEHKVYNYMENKSDSLSQYWMKNQKKITHTL